MNKWSAIIEQAKNMGFKIDRAGTDMGKFYERITLRHPALGRIFAQATYYPNAQQRYSVMFRHSG
jgi:hypothetical protein